MTQHKNALLTINWHNATAEHVHHLLANGAKANVYDIDGWTPLMTACKEGASFGAIKTLVQEGKACVNAANPRNGITALMLACGSHSSTVVRFLLNQGACTGATDKWGWRPMSFAMRHSKTANIKCLRDYERQHD